MQYTVTKVSAVKTQVNVNVPAEEVGAAISAAIAMLKQKVDIKGFRKGKVPASVIESRFKKDLTSEAANDLLNVHINEILGELGAAPLSRIDVDAGEMKKGEDFTYSFNYEHAPDFELPIYDGVAVEQEEVKVTEADVDAVIERIRKNAADVVVISDNRLAIDGDVVVVSFEAFENGQPVPGVRAENFQLTLGEGQALPEFEALVKTIASGGEGEGQITFPADFINTDLADKTVTMKISVHVIKERRLPPIDDELAKKAGSFETLARMREAIEASYLKSRTDLTKAEAQKNLLDGLLATLDFDLPESVVETHMAQLVEQQVERLERRGKSLESTGKTLNELREELLPKAREIVKTQIFLLAVAKKEDLSVAPKEIDAYFYQLSNQTGQDVLTLKQYYEDNNLVVMVKDRLLADKAAELIYERADVKMTPPAAAGAEAPAGDAA